MADIKTRDVTRGNIKTLDRAASYMHHMKEATIRSKALDIYNRQDGENSDTYAQGAVEHYAGDDTVYAARTGVEMILQNRHKSFDSSNYPQSSEEKIRQAFREQGVKTIRSKQQKAKLADAEVLRNAEVSRLADQIGSASTLTSDESIQRNRVSIGKKRHFMPKNDELVQLSRKELAIRRIVGRNDSAVHPLRSLLRTGRVNANRRRASTASRFMTFLWENARTAAATLGVGGVAAIITLTLFVFFGIGIITFSNNSPDTSISDTEEIEYFIPDLAGSPTREAIVKAAAREVGNVGGEKFWRW